jgi:hypothetical protein
MACGWIEVQGFSCRPKDDRAVRMVVFVTGPVRRLGEVRACVRVGNLTAWPVVRRGHTESGLTTF